MDNKTLKEIRRYNNLIGEIDAAYHEAATALGMSDSAMRILYAVCINGDSCLLSTICRLSGLSKQTVNSAIRKLENDDIIFLEQAGSKAKKVCLTHSGKQLVKTTALRIVEIENDIFSSWTKDEVAKYLKLTERFLLLLKDKTQAL